MLVLSRHAGEKIVIGENITITVSRVLPGRVVIGIEAPSDMLVMREELLEVEIDSEPIGSKSNRVGGVKAKKDRGADKSGMASVGEATVAERVMARQSLRDFAKALLSGGTHTVGMHAAGTHAAGTKTGESSNSPSSQHLSSASELHGGELLEIVASGSSEPGLTPVASSSAMIISEPMERCA
jgi:carbon storage regulator